MSSEDLNVTGSSSCKGAPLEKCDESLIKVCERSWKVTEVLEEGHDKLTINKNDKFRFGFDVDGNLSFVLHKRKKEPYYYLVPLDSQQFTPSWFSMDGDNMVVIHCNLSAIRHELIFTFDLKNSRFEYLVGEDGDASNHGRGGGN